MTDTEREDSLIILERANRINIEFIHFEHWDSK